MVAKRRGISAASADGFFLRHGARFSAYESKRTAVWVSGSWPVKFGSRILFTQRALVRVR